MSTPKLPDEKSHPDTQDRLKAFENFIGGSEGTRARSFFNIADQGLFYHAIEASYSSFEQYAANRWGILSPSHCARLRNYGRFLLSLDKMTDSPPGDWPSFLCERHYRFLDGLNLELKEKAAMQIISRVQRPGAVAFTSNEIEKMAAKLQERKPVSAHANCRKPDVTEGRPVDPEIANVPHEEVRGLQEGARQIIRGAEQGDPEALISGLLRIMELAPSALEEIFRCKQPNRAIAKAAAFLGRTKRRKAA